MTATAELVTSRETFAGLSDEWDALFDAASNPAPWRRHAWLMLTWNPGAKAVVVRENGRAVMAGAFVFDRRGLRPTAGFLRGPIPQTDDVLHVPLPQSAEHAQLLLRALGKGLWLPRQFRVLRLPEHSPLRTAPSFCSRRPHEMARQTSFSFLLERHDSFEAYLLSLGSHLRSDHKRRLRRLHEAGAVELRRERAPEAGQTLKWMFDNKRDWVRRTGRKADWLLSGDADRFMAQLQQRPDTANWSVWSLRLGGEIVSSKLCFEEGELWIFQMIAQDDRFRAYAPGRTLNLLCVEQAFAEGVRRVELGYSGDEWKQRLAVPTEAILTERFRLK